MKRNYYPEILDTRNSPFHARDQQAKKLVNFLNPATPQSNGKIVKKRDKNNSYYLVLLFRFPAFPFNSIGKTRNKN